MQNIYILLLLIFFVKCGTLKFSSESPLLYGAFAIILAITLGALAAWMRNIISPMIKKLLIDFRNKNQPKKDEVKFPEK